MPGHVPLWLYPFPSHTSIQAAEEPPMRPHEQGFVLGMHEQGMHVLEPLGGGWRIPCSQDRRQQDTDHPNPREALS
jgi:hypothetical protein